MPVSRKLINLILWFSILIITCNFAICDALAPSPGVNGVELSEVPGIYTLEGETGKVILIIREDNKYQQIYEGFDGEGYIGEWNSWIFTLRQEPFVRIIFKDYIIFFNSTGELIKPIGIFSASDMMTVEYDKDNKIRIQVEFEQPIYYNKKQ